VLQSTIIWICLCRRQRGDGAAQSVGLARQGSTPCSQRENSAHRKAACLQLVGGTVCAAFPCCVTMLFRDLPIRPGCSNDPESLLTFLPWTFVNSIATLSLGRLLHAEQRQIYRTSQEMKPWGLLLCDWNAMYMYEALLPRTTLRPNRHRARIQAPVAPSLYATI
jgi:hypothetical protein